MNSTRRPNLQLSLGHLIAALAHSKLSCSRHMSGGVLVLLVVVLLIVFPQWRGLLAGLFFGAGGDGQTAGENLSVPQARFTNLDGGVRVRKANQVQWTPAELSMALDAGDMIQTGAGGVARIAFADGTLYVIKPETLIVIEENVLLGDQSAMNVTIQVTSGVVDLSTSRLTGESRILFADAEARIYQESRALVTSDPETNTHQITMTRGGANLRRGGEQVTLTEYTQASFGGPDSPIVTEKILAPPILLTPTDMAPVVTAGAQATDVEFTWTEVPEVRAYRLRVSSSPLLSDLVFNRQFRSTSARVPALKEGDYYWTVASIDEGRGESQPSEAYRFSVIRQENEGEILLMVERYIQHGKVIEIIGRTEPGATVLVNNQPVFTVGQDGSFQHFTSPLPDTGPNQITITAQNREGKIATLRKTITIQ